MVEQLQDLIGFTLHATDGDIGRVYDVYFDDRHWTVRYLVVDTRHWLPGRRVLLSPVSIRHADWARREIVVGLSREQIRRSPSVDTDQPLGRRKIALFRECYTMPYSWALGGFFWGPGSQRGAPAKTSRRREGDPRLESTRLVSAYRVTAIDGDVGHVGGFLVDDDSWALRALIVKTPLAFRQASARALGPDRLDELDRAHGSPRSSTGAHRARARLRPVAPDSGAEYGHPREEGAAGGAERPDDVTRDVGDDGAGAAAAASVRRGSGRGVLAGVGSAGRAMTEPLFVSAPRPVGP